MRIHLSSRTLRRAPLGLALALSPIVESASLAAQEPKDPRDTTHAQTQAPFFTRKDAIIGGSFVAATFLMFPLDRRVARSLQDSSTQANRLFRHATTDVEVITSPGAYIIGGTLYVVGMVGKWDRVADLGWHGTEAVLFAQGVTSLLKGVAGRARP